MDGDDAAARAYEDEEFEDGGVGNEYANEDYQEATEAGAGGGEEDRQRGVSPVGGAARNHHDREVGGGGRGGGGAVAGPQGGDNATRPQPKAPAAQRSRRQQQQRRRQCGPGGSAMVPARNAGAERNPEELPAPLAVTSPDPNVEAANRASTKQRKALPPEALAADPQAFRHFQPTHPATNRLLAKRWDDERHELHKEKLRRAAATIDCDLPRACLALRGNPKRRQNEADRQSEIDRDNRILVARMGGIAAALVPGDDAPLPKAGVCSPEERLEQFRRRAELHRRTEADRIVKENRVNKAGGRPYGIQLTGWLFPT
ncbi:hypothetical protein HK405_002151 [Cladochytrium tenue]|nr:hypothetical protein HK405_002151 [Cladochytrium tenue]